MKEGHQTWNNVVMLTKGGRERGADHLYYYLANTYLSTWFGALTLKTYGFAPQMMGVDGDPLFENEKLQPLEAHGVKLMAIGFMAFAGVQL